MRRYRVLGIGAVALLFATVATGDEATRSKGPALIHLTVAPDGDDAAEGTVQSPLATLSGARDRVRRLRADGGLAGASVKVSVRAGSYPVLSPFILGEQDGGSAQAPVVYCAAEGEEVRLVGGVEISGTAFGQVEDEAVLGRIPEEARGKVLCADLADLGLGDLKQQPDQYRSLTGPELFFEGERMTLARYPNEGWLTFTEEQVVDRGTTSKSEAGEEERGGTFEYTDDHPNRWSVEHGAWLYGYWCWDWYGETYRVGAIDAEKKHITLAAPHGYGIGPAVDWNTAPRRYCALNLLEELDAPGEWFLAAQEKTLYFYPPSELEGARVVLSACPETMVQVKDARHVSLRRLVIECGQNSAFSIGGSDNVVEDCEVRNMGGGAGGLAGERNGVRRCHLHHLGGSGIGTGSGDRRNLIPAGNFIEDCHIHHFGIHQRTYAPAIGLRGCGNRASRNLIHDAPHEALEYAGNDHVIEYNEIHHVLMETSDAGAIYTGRDWTLYGNVIRHNFIHDLGGFGVGGGYAIYLDDQASGTSVIGNVLYKAGGGILLAGGRSIRAENNLMIESAKAFTLSDRIPAAGPAVPFAEDETIMQRLRAVPYQEEPWRSRFPQLTNILEDDPRLPKYNVIRDNLVVNCAESIYYHGDTDTYWHDEANHNVFGPNYVREDDPGFVDPENLDFRLRWDSPVWTECLTFRRIPFEEIGPRSG